MSSNEIRYMELHYRKATLNNLRKKTEEELTSKAMILMAKSMDKDIENKLNGSHSMIKRWIKEIEEEINQCEELIFNDIAAKDYGVAMNSYKNSREDDSNLF